MAKTGYLKRYRFPILVIRAAVILHMLLPSRIVSLILYLLLRVNVTHKTVCEWTTKFSGNIILPQYTCTADILICHVDEKYVKVNGECCYWWSLKDMLGNMIHAIVTKLRDFASAKKLLVEAREKIGRKCKSVIAGINGKGFIYKKNFYWLTNNPAESLNSEIDFYLGKFQNNFENIESANKFARIFMLLKHLKKKFMEKKFLEASLALEQAIGI